MNTNGYVLAKVVSFLYDKNIDLIPKIYGGKIESYLVAHLLEKAHYCREKHNDNKDEYFEEVETENKYYKSHIIKIEKIV